MLPADMLMSLLRKERELGIKPDPAVDAYLKACPSLPSTISAMRFHPNVLENGSRATVPMLRLTARCTFECGRGQHLLLLGQVVSGLDLGSAEGLPRLSIGRARARRRAPWREGGRAWSRTTC